MARRARSLATLGNALVLALLALDGAAHGQAFQASGSSNPFGSVTINNSVANNTTVTVNTSRATINWTPSDNPSSSAPFVFLPSGTTATYQGGAALSGGAYTVLNRIIPNSAKAIQFDGTVNSDAAGHIWFYTPGGMIIGSSARFNVGSLLLTTADPVLDPNSDFMPTAGHFQLAGTAGSQSAIVIQSGAQLNATTVGQSNYVVALAPRIQQDGAISVRGSAVLVAAEGATFAIDSTGLFTISVDAANQGTTVTGTDALSHSGSTGGPDAGAAGSPRRVYLMAVPKNSAITMAIQSGGSLGFAIASAANVSGNAIVLSGGRNIADTGTGNPITGPSLINQPVTINIARGNYTSGVWAGSNDTINIADTVAGGTPDIKFAGQLFASGNVVNMNLTQGTNTVGGKLTLDVTGDLVRAAGSASLSLDGASTSLTVTGGIDLLARNGQLGTGTTSSAAYYNTAGNTAVSASNGAVLSASGNIRAISNALGQSNGAYPAFAPSSGGTSSITANNGGRILSTGGLVVAIANGFGLTAAGATSTSPAIDAQGGSAQIVAAGPSSLISAATGIIIQAGGTGGTDTISGIGGSGTGGTSQLSALSGGRIVAGTSIQVAADGIAGNGAASGGSGGAATGGYAQIIAADGTIADGTTAGFAATAITLEASAQGGNGTVLGPAGSAAAGNALLQTSGLSAAIDAGAGITVSADASSGTAAGGPGRSATGGTVTFGTTGAGQAIGSLNPAPITVSAQAMLGASNGGIAGDANAGTVKFGVSGGSISATTLTLTAAATGDATAHNSGEVQSGTVHLDVNNGGLITATGAASFSAAATSSAETDPSNGGVAAGQIVINNPGGTLHLFGTTSFDVGVTVSGSLAPTDFYTGTALVTSAPSTFTAFGTAPTGAGNIDLAQTTLVGSGDYSFAAAGNINLASGAFSSTASNVNLALLADSAGTGTGTVYFANGAISLSGSGSSTNFFYNPAVFGTPTDFSSAVLAGSWTGFQLVNNLTDLQNINNFLTQNFALGKSLDATETISWNGGLGFVPLGTDGAGTVLNGGNGFTGEFHGLGHVITGLVVNRPSAFNTGLIGFQGAGGFIGHIGLVGGSIVGDFYVGGLVGQGLGTIDRAFSDIAVTGAGGYVGGLVGKLWVGGSISRSFATSTVDGGTVTGGLVGISNGTITSVYATGNVAGTTYVGGLIGINNSSLLRVYATGDATGQSSVGGITGVNNGSISESYASGAVSSLGAAGGISGDNTGSITNTYWDSYSTHQVNPVSTGSVGLTNVLAVTSDPQQQAANNWAFSPTSYSNFSGLYWYSFNNVTRPLGLWELRNNRLLNGTVLSIHELQALTLRPNQDFKLGADIDASETSRLSGIWGTAGFIPIGAAGSRVANFGTPYLGNFDGAGHVISGLTINQGGSDLGLFATLQGTVSNLGLVNVAIGTGPIRAGAIAGTNNGIIRNSFATGVVTANLAAGGLVGSNGPGGTIHESYSSVAVTGVQIDGTPAVGGIAGLNFGKIDTVYANGAVSGGTKGGLVGSNDAMATITNSYWDTQLTGLAQACGADAGTRCSAPVGLTTAQSQSANSYVGWSMDSSGGRNTVWRIYEGQTAPLLKVFLRPHTVDAASTSLAYDGTVHSIFVPTPVGIDPSHLFGQGVTSRAGPNSGNYTLTYAGGYYSDQRGYDLISGATGTLTINPAALTISTVTDSKTYTGTTASTGTPTVSGLLGNDSVTNLSQVFDSANAGPRSLLVGPGYTVNDGNSGGNYTVNTISASGTISPAPLTVTANNATITYTAGAFSGGNGVSYSGFVNGETSAVLGGTLGYSGTSQGARNVGSYVITPGGLLANNYTISFANGSLTINPALLTLAATSDTRTYTGLATSTATPTVTGLLGTDTVTGLTQTFGVPNAGARTLTVNPGYTINDGNGGLNYTVSAVTAAGTINPAPLTITANNVTFTYSGLFNPGNPTATYTGFVNGEGPANLGSFVGFTGTFTTARNVGTYTINPQLPAVNNYVVTLVSGTETITPAPLTINAVTDTKVYNASAVSTVAPTFSGLVGSDTVSGLSQAFDSANAGARTLAVNSGYTINDGNGGANYAVTLNTAAGSITPATATITYTANPASSTYGNLPAGLTGSVGVTPLFGNDSLATITSGTAAFTTPAGATSAVGTYAINGGGLAAATGNYTITFAQAQGNATALTIIPRPLVVTGSALSRIYGNANPALTYTVGGQGLVNGDTLTGAPTTTATVTSNIGSYPISQGSLAASGNYTLTFTPGTLAVTARPLTVTADSFSRAYGDANPALTYTLGGQGLANSDQLTGALATTAALTSSVGNYAVTQGSVAASSNYVLTFVAGNIAVTARPVTITATSLSRFTTDPNPALTYTVGGQGLVNGDQLTGALTTTAAAGSPPSTYPISQGTLAATSNYAVTFVPGVLTVNACVLSAGCSADVSSQVTQQIAPAVQPPPVSPAAQTPQQQQQQEQQQEQEKKDTAKADNSGKPQVVAQTLVNTGGLNTPPPVNEPVTGTGNFNVDFQGNGSGGSSGGGGDGAPPAGNVGGLDAQPGANQGGAQQ